MKRVYIVLSTTGVGGAEKRFTDIWSALSTHGLDIHLVMDVRTHAGLQRQKGYGEKLSPSPNLHVLDFGGTYYRDFVHAAWKFFRAEPHHAIVHYPLAYAPFLQKRFGHRVIVSWVNSALPPLALRSFKREAISWASFFAADRIDVLNPENARSIARIPLLRRKTSLTAGGTHIDPLVYLPRKKQLDFVFLGRIEPEKQSLRFMQTLPAVHQTLRANGYDGYRFVLCGDGSEMAAIQSLSTSEAYRDVPVVLGYSNEPEVILGHSAVYFSLQRTSNYPSKALAEAMACGAYPVMTDTGDTRLMVSQSAPHRLVPRDFTATNIADALLHYLALQPAERERVATEISDFAVHRFARETQASYFAHVYEQVSRA